jgi:hypothetical protein
MDLRILRNLRDLSIVNIIVKLVLTILTLVMHVYVKTASMSGYNAPIAMNSVTVSITALKEGRV